MCLRFLKVCVNKLRLLAKNLCVCVVLNLPKIGHQTQKRKAPLGFSYSFCYSKCRRSGVVFKLKWQRRVWYIWCGLLWGCGRESNLHAVGQAKGWHFCSESGVARSGSSAGCSPSCWVPPGTWSLFSVLQQHFETVVIGLLNSGCGTETNK